MQNVEAYELVSGTTPEEFNEKIAEMIALGFRPHGSPQLAEQVIYVQAMVREPSPENGDLQKTVREKWNKAAGIQ